MSVNKKFLEYIEELITSLIYYSSRQINIYLMYIENELDKDNIEHIKNFVLNTKKAELIPIKFDARQLEGAPVTDNCGAFFGLEAYSRLFSAFNLPDNVEKVLYLDADMICTGDISELYNQEFDGKTWIACKDLGIKSQDLNRLDLPENYEYINSGMLLLNTKKYKENYTAQDIFKLIKDNEKYLKYPDQDFINKFFKDDIKIIDNKYNLIAKDVRYKSLKEKPLIIHYAGSVKPWDDNVSRFEEEYLKPYYEALEFQGEYKKEKLKTLIEKHKNNGYRD